MEDINILINKTTRMVVLSKVTLGNDGESLQENLVFSFNDEFVNGTARLELTMPDDTNSYIMLTKVGETYQLPVKSVMTQEGKISMQLVITEGTSEEDIPIFKSNVFSLKVRKSINAETISEDEYPDFIDKAETKLNSMDEALEDVNSAIEEVENLDLDVSKSGKVATVTLTKKDTTTKSVTLSDGTSLQFQWSGTSLGIKTDNDSEYTYVDLQGVQGPIGPKGEAFTIKKTYTSVAEMNADFNNMQLGDYVMIASTVEVEDNAKLYTRGESQWIFISDFSGAQGIRGETGLTPSIQIGTVVTGQTSSVTRTGTNENPILNFVLEKGETGATGQTGATGATGNGIASITKTGTSGLVDTYTITYTDGTTTTFNITNGEDGEVTLTQFNKLKQRVEDLETNQSTYTKTGTDIEINDAHEMNVAELKLSKESSQAGEPSPSNPVEIKTVTGYRNLFDKNNSIILNAYVGQSSHIIISGTANFRTVAIPCKPNTNYFIKKFLGATVLITGTSTDIPSYGTELNQFSLQDRQNKYTFTTNSTANYLIAQICTNSDTNLGYTPQQILDNFQITEGNDELPYVPYGTNWIYTTVSDGTNSRIITIPLNNNEIVGLGDYKDELIIDSDGHCWKNKKINKYILTSTTGGDSTGRTNTIRETYPNILEGIEALNNSSQLCTHFTRSTSIWDNDREGFSISGKRITFSISKEITASSSAINTWLGTNKPEFYYVLVTPQLVDLQYDVDLRLFNGINEITNSDDMDMKIKYVIDIENVLDSKQDTLISGTNIKTINNQSILGEGNISVGGGSGGTSDYTDLENKPQINNVTLSGNKTTSDLGISYNDLTNKPTIPSEVTETTVTNWGFTKNEGTITGITMNGASKGTSGVVDLGTVITSHQDISGKLDTSKVKSAMSTTSGDVYDVTYINGLIGNINTILATLTTPGGN